MIKFFRSGGSHALLAALIAILLALFAGASPALAQDSVEPTTEADADDPEALVSLAESLEAEGDHQGAFDAYYLASQWAADHPTEVLANLGASYAIFFGLYLIRPLALVGGQRFSLARTSWNNLRFRFTGTLSDAYKLYLGDALLLAGTLGLALPWAVTHLELPALGPDLPTAKLVVLDTTFLEEVEDAQDRFGSSGRSTLQRTRRRIGLGGWILIVAVAAPPHLRHVHRRASKPARADFSGHGGCSRRQSFRGRLRGMESLAQRGIRPPHPTDGR